YFFFPASPPSALYTLSLHDALPILLGVFVALDAATVLAVLASQSKVAPVVLGGVAIGFGAVLALLLVRAKHTKVFVFLPWSVARSEEHTSELQSRSDLVCRLLLEKK